MQKISRRDFLKIGAAGVGALLLPRAKHVSSAMQEIPTSENLGRLFYTVDVMSKPDSNSIIVESIFAPKVISLYSEILGENGLYGYRPRTWYETDGGYIYAPTVQPVKNLINEPVIELPTYGNQAGFWAEVTVPWVNLELDGENPQAPIFIDLINTNQPLRFYYSQVVWVDNITTDGYGQVLYHVLEKHGSYGDSFWADGKAFKILTPEDLSPIRPEVTDKSIVVDVTKQSLACYEGTSEIFYTIVSTGAKNTFDGQVTDAWSTPVGDYYAVNRKFVSLHMAGGDNKASGYEETAVAFTSIFATGGISFHSTYWHNAWGTPMSHGCVNMKPEEAKFVYRWSQPDAPYEDGKYEQMGYDGTKVRVIE